MVLKIAQALKGYGSFFLQCRVYISILQICSCSRHFSTVCQGSSDPFHIVTYYIKWVTTSWTYSSKQNWPTNRRTDKQSDRTNFVILVCILGYNSTEWAISNLASVHAQGFATGIYQVKEGVIKD